MRAGHVAATALSRTQISAVFVAGGRSVAQACTSGRAVLLVAVVTAFTS